MIRYVLALTMFTVVITTVSGASAQPAIPQPLWVIDKPTAGILDHGTYVLHARTGPESSFLVGAGVGVSGLFQAGLSWGMQGLFEQGNPQFNDRVGVQARLRIIEETKLPAIALGFDSQGQGRYHSETDLRRYDRKSLGFYAVASKNFALIVGELSLHAGLNQSLERVDDDDPNVFAAVDLTFARRLSLLLDADAGFNDDSGVPGFGQGGGYVDAGTRLTFGDVAVVTFIFRDLTGNASSSVGRELRFAFIHSL